MAYRTIGNTIIEWADHYPHIFTLTEEAGPKSDRKPRSFQFDLSPLLVGFTEDFLINLRDQLIERRNQVALRSVQTEYEMHMALFRRIITSNLFNTKIAVIDHNFLLAITTILEDLPKVCLEHFRRLFKFNPHSQMFSPELREEDFPIKQDKKRCRGRQINRILSKALTRASCVQILKSCEESYEDDLIDIGLYSFIQLAFSVYCRTDSYRRIKVSDLIYDTEEEAFFLYIPPAKTGVHQPDNICYRINRNVGELLQQQRQAVIDHFGPLIDQNDINKLAMFPARRCSTANRTKWFPRKVKNFGEAENSGDFIMYYYRPIRKHVLKSQLLLGSTMLRHTVGTQLALAGCSSKTIQAILKHATDTTCQSYVDIVFHGLINELSDAIQPEFERHMPVFQKFRSKKDSIASDKAVFTEDIDTGRTVLTGECGKQIHCEAAPLVCYECNKFIPCFDADHSLNLDIIQKEINIYRYAGTAYQHLVEKAKSIKYSIQLVMAAADRYHQTVNIQGELR